VIGSADQEAERILRTARAEAERLVAEASRQVEHVVREAGSRAAPAGGDGAPWVLEEFERLDLELDGSLFDLLAESGSQLRLLPGSSTSDAWPLGSAPPRRWRPG
jgi:hypothetical protein